MQIVFVRHGEPFGSDVGKSVVDEYRCYVKHIVGHVVFVDVVHSVAQEAACLLGFIFGNQYFGLQIEAVDVVHITDERCIVPGFFNVLLVNECYTCLENKWQHCTGVQMHSVVENVFSPRFVFFVVVVFGNVRQFVALEVFVLANLQGAFVAL